MKLWQTPSMEYDWGRRVRLLVLGGLIASAGLTGTPRAWAVTDEERAAARSLAEQGATAFNEERYQDAVNLFSRAESVVHSPVHLLFIARGNVKLGNLVKAHEAYVKVSRQELGPDAPDAFKAAARDAATELKALKPRIPHLTVRIVGQDGAKPELFIDGEPVPPALIGVPIPVDPGTRKLEVRAEGMQTATGESILKEGENAEIELTLVPLASSDATPKTIATPPPAEAGGNNTMRYAAYGALGVGVVGLGVGTWFALSASSTQQDSDNLFGSCDPNCSASQSDKISSLDDDAAHDNTLALTGFIVGGVGVGAGIALWLLSSSSDESASSEPHITPWVGYNSAGVSGTF